MIRLKHCRTQIRPGSPLFGILPRRAIKSREVDVQAAGLDSVREHVSLGFR